MGRECGGLMVLMVPAPRYDRFVGNCSGLGMEQEAVEVLYQVGEAGGHIDPVWTLYGIC